MSIKSPTITQWHEVKQYSKEHATYVALHICKVKDFSSIKGTSGETIISKSQGILHQMPPYMCKAPYDPIIKNVFTSQPPSVGSIHGRR